MSRGASHDDSEGGDAPAETRSPRRCCCGCWRRVGFQRSGCRPRSTGISGPYSCIAISGSGCGRACRTRCTRSRWRTAYFSTLRRGMRVAGGDARPGSRRCAFHSDGSDAGQGEGVLTIRTSAPTTVTAGASMRMTRHLATSTPERAATRVAATAPPVAINNHAWKT